MKKVLLMLCLLSVGTVYAQDQSKEKFSANAGMELFVPVGGIKEKYVAGIGQNLQLEYELGKVVTTTLSSGYYYIVGKVHEPALTQYPVLLGLKFRVAPTAFFHQTGGLVFVNQGIGFKFMYTSGMVMEFERFVSDMKIISTIVDQTGKSYLGIGLRLGYKF
jgi:hypothetical protein